MISKSKLIFFAATSNILLMNLVCFSTLCDLYKQSSWQYLIFYIILAVIMSIIFAGFSEKTNILKKLRKNYLIRSLLIIYLTIVISLITLFVSITMKKYFYFKADIVILFSVLLVTALILSTGNFKNIVDQGTFLFLIAFVAYIIPISHLNERDFTLLLPLDFDILEIFKALAILIFPLDNLLFALQSDTIKGGFTRKTYLLCNLFSGLYILFILIDAISLVGANFYVDMRYSGLFRWQLFQGNKFIENFSIFLLIMMVITSVYRLAFYFDCFKKMAFLRRTHWTFAGIFVFFFAICFTLYHYITYIGIIGKNALYLGAGVLFIVYVWFVAFSYKMKRSLNYGPNI